jgi:predicted dehydrogenase
LNDASIDAIELLTPTYMHADHIMAALQAGKHVSCQQPMCTTVAEANRIITAVEKADKSFRVTEKFIYDPPILKAKELLETGSIAMQGNAQELLQDDGVKKAYLGI